MAVKIGKARIENNYLKGDYTYTHTLDEIRKVLSQFHLVDAARQASPCRSCVATRVSEPQVRSTRVAFGHEPQ